MNPGPQAIGEHSTYKANELDICMMVRVFANGNGDRGSIPGLVIPKTQKMVLDASLLNTQHYKVWVKGKEGKSRERSSASPTHQCSSYRKGNLWATLTILDVIINRIKIKTNLREIVILFFTFKKFQQTKFFFNNNNNNNNNCSSSIKELLWIIIPRNNSDLKSKEINLD